jgi:hypothetical protein
MNNYITLDGFKYVTPFGKWTPVMDKPATARIDLLGGLDVTYGPATWQRWQGMIEVAANPTTGYGSPYELRATLAKRTAVTFVDHYGETYNVHLLGPFPEMSFTPVWDGNSNVIFFQLTVVGIWVPIPSSSISPSVSKSISPSGSSSPSSSNSASISPSTSISESSSESPSLSLSAPSCYLLTLGHTGNGADPTPDIGSSDGCSEGYYVEGEYIALVDATPDSGWEVGSWTGSDNDLHNGEANALTMPAEAHEVLVNYIETP